MSVKLTFVSAGDGGGISRSCSFTGFSTMQSRKLAKSLGRSSVRSRMSLRSPKAYSSLQKGEVIWDPKPLQVKKIFEALKKGLNEYLEAHQAELDYLSGCHKDTKRNSRLVRIFLMLIPVEELYEAYCIQCRLRDGAANMKQAFSLSPSTKASRESLVELYKNFQGCTEDMCFIEGALECLSSSLHVFQVFVRLGRQKWKLKGKIETDDSQTWDEEEKIFIPNLHEKFEIKVTELRGLATILVGVVTCDSINFFTTKPQAIIVDITELGTIKLQLEVLWNPFDTDNLFLSPGTTAKFSVGSRKSSLYNWTPPNTPSFREKYYLSALHQRHNEGDVREEGQPPSILSYLAACDFGGQPRSKGPSTAGTSEVDSLSSEDQKGTESRNTTPALGRRTLPLVIIQETSAEERQRPLPNHTTLDILKKTPCVDGFPNTPSSFVIRGKDSRDSVSQTRNHCLTEQENVSQRSLNAENDLKVDGCAKSIDKTLQEVLNLLKFWDMRQAQLEKLEYQVLSMRDKLKLKTLAHKHSSMESLMVETVLESFDFLNTDCSADELSLFGSVRTASIRYVSALTTLSFFFPVVFVLPPVLQSLLEQIVTCDGLLPSPYLQTEPVTLFQFCNYLEKHHITSLEKHLGKLAKEVMLMEELQCPGRLRTLKKLKGKRLNRLQPLPRTLRLLGLLQLDDNHRVSKAATSCLCRLAANRSLREKALLFYTGVLADCDARLQQAACLALKNLRGIESIEEVAHLCQSEVEEVRNAARETTLSFGEKGRQAFEKMDRICCELRDTVHQEAEIEITVF
uniref:RIPOR family member 3 n=1 Tax=Nothoprocta perdicaria TaxID=30464 RepID=A0A8C6ZER0_NOTPE